MGVKVNASQAAALAGWSEKRIRAAIRRGDLPAEEDTAQGGRVAREASDAGGRRVGPSRWAVDSDDLLKLPGARINQVMLAELKAQSDASSQGMLARLAELERQVRDLQRQVRDLRARSFGSARETSGSGVLSTHAAAGGELVGEGGRVSYPQGPMPLESPLSASGDVSAIFGAAGGLAPAARGIDSAYPPPRSYRGPRTVALADRGPGVPLRFRTKSDAARFLSRHGINELTPKSWRGWPPDELTPAATLAFALGIQQDAIARGDWRVTWRLRRCTDGACDCQEMVEA